MGKASKFRVKITIGNVKLPYPKRGDCWLLQAFIRVGYSGDRLARLNRVRLFMQVAFLSEVLCAKGKTLDRRYLQRRGESERWSMIRFPK